jgi:hypothetical protein
MVMMVHSILDRIRASAIRRGGFPYGVIENALPEDCYEALSASYPSLDFVAGSETVKRNAAVV